MVWDIKLRFSFKYTEFEAEFRNCIMRQLEIWNWNLGRRSKLGLCIWKSSTMRGELVETFEDKGRERRGPKLSQGVPAYMSGWESEAESLFMRAEKILVPQRNLIDI